MSKIPLILIGGGGHCKACIDVIELEGKYCIEGILDLPEQVGNKILGYGIIGTDSDIDRLIKIGFSFLITVGQIKSSLTRQILYNRLEVNNARIATVISPTSRVSKYSQIGVGSIVMHGVNVNAAVSIGVNCILNNGCNVEHDSIVGNNVHVSTHAVINGGCVIGNDSFIGSNATVSSYTKICANVILGAGSTLVNDIYEPGIFVGIPAKRKFV